MQAEQRQHPRHPISWRAAIFPGSSETPLPGKVLEISAGGCCIFQPRNLPPGAVCRLLFEIPRPDFKARDYLELEASVIHSCLVGDVAQYRTGFKFRQGHPKLNEIISHLQY